MSEGVEEKIWCDGCGIEACGELKFTGWYGSDFDMKQFKLHFCDDCWKMVREQVADGFGTVWKKEDINEL